MLSDMHASRRSFTGNTRLVFAQSGLPEKSEFFFNVFTLLSPFCTPEMVPHIKTWVDARNLATSTSINFATMQLPCFNAIHSLFYTVKGAKPNGQPNYVKIVPTNIIELLTPISLAYWIMGDGSKQNQGIHLSVYGFSMTECDLLIQALTQKFGLNCTIHNTKSGPRIYIDAASTLIVRDLVRPYMVRPQLIGAYKIGL